jgi:hypothetical protein
VPYIGETLPDEKLFEILGKLDNLMRDTCRDFRRVYPDSQLSFDGGGINNKNIWHGAILSETDIKIEMNWDYYPKYTVTIIFER